LLKPEKGSALGYEPRKNGRKRKTKGEVGVRIMVERPERRFKGGTGRSSSWVRQQERLVVQEGRSSQHSTKPAKPV